MSKMSQLVLEQEALGVVEVDEVRVTLAREVDDLEKALAYLARTYALAGGRQNIVDDVKEEILAEVLAAAEAATNTPREVSCWEEAFCDQLRERLQK